MNQMRNRVQILTVGKILGGLLLLWGNCVPRFFPDPGIFPREGYDPITFRRRPYLS
jgi:hypothetical protein